MSDQQRESVAAQVAELEAQVSPGRVRIDPAVSGLIQAENEDGSYIRIANVSPLAGWRSAEESDANGRRFVLGANHLGRCLRALEAAEVLRRHEIANDADHWCEFDFDQGVEVDHLRKKALAVVARDLAAMKQSAEKGK